MRHTAVVLVFCLSAFVATAQPAPPPEPPVAFLDATLIDPTRDHESSGMTILVDGGIIRAIFPTGSRSLPPGTLTHDLEDRFLIPGLIDAHKHLTAMFHRQSPQRMRAVLERMYGSGIVAIRDMAGDARLVAHVADLAAAGEIPAPEVYYSAVVGSPHFARADPRMARAGRGFEPGETAWAQAITPQSDLERAVTRADALGVTGLKVYLGLDAETLRALTDEAHRQGLKVWAHATAYPLRPLEVVRGGVDSISHACGLAWQDRRLDPAQYTETSIRNRPRFDPDLVDPNSDEMKELFAEMVRRGTSLEPTLSGHARPGDDAFGCTTDLTVALAKAAKAAGVPLVAGTDYETPPDEGFPALFLELEHLVDSGVLTPHEALTASTITAARALGIEERFGTIERGKMASFIVLDRDPREDIRNLRSGITAVVHRGTYRPNGGGPTPLPIAEADGYSAEEAAAFHRTTDVESWDDGGERSRFVYTHPSEVFPQAVIHRRGPVSELPYDLKPEIGEHEAPLASGARTSLDDYVTSSGIDGFVLLHRGRIVYEAYPGMRQHDKHIAFSVTKAVVGIAVGILEERGEIDLGRTIDFYIPELAGTDWTGIAVVDILDMASGMENGEADPEWWRDPLNKHFQLEASLGWMPRTPEQAEAARRGETYRFLKSLERVEEPGKRYDYNSANTAVLGWLLEEVTGKPLAEVLSEELWSKLGAESDALLGVNENGVPIAHAGMATTLRDLARFGLLFTESWEAVSDRRVLSEELLGRIREDQRREPLESLRPGAEHVAYHWDGVTEDGALFKGGFAGQLLIVFPSEDVVIAYFGTNADLDSPFPRLDLAPLVDDLF